MKEALVKPNIMEELMVYSPKDLRAAANWIDRENNVFPLINVLSLSQKLKALDGSLRFITGESGEIKFWLEEKGSYVIRNFASAKELSAAITLGPVDIFWLSNLFLKTKLGNLPITPTRHDPDKNQLHFRVNSTKEKRFVWLNGAEKILCNSKEGLTAGQMKLDK